MIKNFEEFAAKAKALSKARTVVVAAAHDEHALEAVLKAHADGVVNYILVGHKDEIINKAENLGYVAAENCIIESRSDNEAAFKSVELIRNGQGDVLMKGKMETSTLLHEVVNRETGIGKGGIMSHMAILQIPSYHKIVGFTDGGMCMYPDLDQKQAILENALELFRGLGYQEPKVSVVAAVEVVNPKMRETIDAAEIKKMAAQGRFGRCIADGPISMDLTFSKEAAEIKGFESPVTGDVDIVLVPDIAVGNISTKGLICLAGAEMAGCVLGAKVPIVLPSRGSSFEEKYYSLMLCAAID